MSDAADDAAAAPLTLERWQHLLAAPQTLRCPKMTLMAGDWEPPIVEGSGEIRFTTPAGFEFTLDGMPDDIGYTLRQLKRQRDNSYDGLKRFRLVAMTDDGVEYAAGWTIPDLTTGDTAWNFSGQCEGLITDDKATPVTPAGGTEAQFIIPRHHRAALILGRFVSTEKDGRRIPTYDLSIDGAKIRFSYDDAAELLTVRTDGSELLPLTYTENWLGEPLRILFGQLVFPRLVARNFPKGGAMVSVRPAPAWRSDSDWAALWSGKDALSGKEEFWRLYGELLTFIANTRGFESHKVTSLYEEVIQAARGSRWVWALTFASSIEGLVKILTPKVAKRPDAKADDIASLVAHIEAWPGADGRLRQSAVNAVHRTAEATPRYVLTELKKLGLVTDGQIKAWEKIRNAVMHGSLVSPYSSEEDDGHLLALAALMHALTRLVVSEDPPSIPLASAPAETAG